MSLQHDEQILKKRLLYDGHGSGDDRRLLNLMKNISKLCLCDESKEDEVKTLNLITKELNAAISSAEKYDKMSEMYDRMFSELDKAIEIQSLHKETVRSELKSLELELEYATKLKQVNNYPDSSTTEQSMKDIEKRKQRLLDKIEKYKINLRSLADACRSLQQILDDENPDIIEIFDSETGG